MRAGAGDLVQPRVVRVLDDEPIALRLLVLQESLEPRALRGAVIQDVIEREVEVFAERRHVPPVADGGVDVAVVDDAEPVVAAVREVRQQVDRGEPVAHPRVQQPVPLGGEGVRRGSGGDAVGPHHVAVGDEDGVRLVPQVPRSSRRTGCRNIGVAVGEGVDPGEGRVGGVAVEGGQLIEDRRAGVVGQGHDSVGPAVPAVCEYRSLRKPFRVAPGRHSRPYMSSPVRLETRLFSFRRSTE